jgi:hypothetical protein
MVDAVNTNYIPLGIEHDPRISPQGRIVKAWLEERPDGGMAAMGEIELFDGDSKTPTMSDSRELRIKTFDPEQILISFDRNFRGAEDQKLLSDLASSLNAKLQEEFKKALDPISVLAIGGALFLLGGIAKGFLGKLGSDGYEVLKQALKKLFTRPKEGEKDRLLMLEFELERQGERFVVEVIASNPTPEEIDSLLGLELQRLDKLIADIFTTNTGLKKLVFELGKEGIALKFAVRRDCVPLILKQKEPGA